MRAEKRSLPQALLTAWKKARKRPLLATGTALLLPAILLSCSTVTRTVVAPPSVPGATFVGSKVCEECHEEICRDFKTASHARIQAKGPNAVELGCESCHGPGSIHSEKGGGSDNIINPGKSPQVCYECHLDVRGEFQLPYHHPIGPGKLTCGECHPPHKGSAHRGGGTARFSENEICLECHPAQRGPYVFEHEATREGCTSCHRPHGSVNAKLLTERNATLCLKCHFQQQTAGGAIYIGGFAHTSALRRGTCWTAGCHEAVHGSQVTSSLRY
jgi:predicted CXXCH cytochrome family protein